VRLTPAAAGKKKRESGALKGIWPELPDSFFFDPLSEDELELWEGRASDDPLR